MDPNPVLRSDDDSLTLNVLADEHRCVVVAQGELDTRSAQSLLDQLHRLLDEGPEEVVLDLRGVAFMDSTGLSCLLQAARRSRARRDQLKIIAPLKPADRVFELTNIRRFLPLVPA